VERAANEQVVPGHDGSRAVVDCVVAADEMLNLPHIDLETVGNFAVAKIRKGCSQ
jgi:hypothetical protein